MQLAALLLEVMDKEPSSLDIWVFYLLVAAIGFSLCWFRYWLLAGVLPIVLLLGVAWLVELHDEFVGPAIIQEAGYRYIIQSYLATAISIVAPCIGAAINWKKRTIVEKVSVGVRQKSDLS